MATNAPSGPPTIRQAPPGTQLIAMDLSSEHERDVLRAQRVICGWNEEKVPRWAENMAAGDRTFFWIALRPSPDDNTLVTRGDTSFVPAGHVSLDKVDLSGPDEVPDTSLAYPSACVQTITSLFVLPEYTKFGLGAFAMDECERLARVAGCVAVTINALSPRYCQDGGVPGPDGLGRWAELGVTQIPRGMQAWYLKRGYVTYKEEPRYYGEIQKGNTVGWNAIFMRKELV